MDSRKYVVPAVVVLSLVILILALFSRGTYSANMPAVSEPYMKKFDCYLHPPDVICSADVCNGGPAAIRDVRLTVHVFDELNRHYTAFDEISVINPPSPPTEECGELTAELHNEDLGKDVKLKGVLSYTSGRGVKVDGITLFNIW
ncbi:MAG: hypothetical protein V1921_02695 [Candidatus Altiarchaeota archaeon]